MAHGNEDGATKCYPINTAQCWLLFVAALLLNVPPGLAQTTGAGLGQAFTAPLPAGAR